MKERALRFASRNPWVGPLGALLFVYAFFAVLAPSTFARSQNLVTMARQTAALGIAGAGATLVIVLGGIDLSVGSVVALCTVVAATALKAGFGAAGAALAAVLVATAAGFVNGALTTALDVTPFLVTLGTMSILRGAAKGLAHEQKVDVDPAGLDNLVLPSKGLFGLPIAVWLLAVVAVGVASTLRFTRFGRHVVAVGSNERTARLCGISTSRVKISVYALAGALAGLAGILEFGTLTVGDPTDSAGLELEVIASVVLGGASLSGGEGSVGGTLLGAFLMTVIKTGCTHLGLSNWVQELVTGGIIVVAVALDRVRRARA